VFFYNPTLKADSTVIISLCLSHLGREKAEAQQHKEQQESTDLKKNQTECSYQQTALPQLLLHLR